MEEAHGCDACGHSKFGWSHISTAKFRIAVKGGAIYLCGHHFHKHRAHIIVRGYVATEVEQ